MGEVTLNQKVEKIFEEQIYFDDYGIRSNDSKRITENIRKVNTRIRQAEKARYNLDNWINEYELDPDIRLQDKEEQKEYKKYKMFFLWETTRSCKKNHCWTRCVYL